MGQDNVTYRSRSTNVIFSAISATRFAILDAMMPYGDGVCTAPFVAAPLAVGFGFVLEAFLRDAGVFALVRLTGAEAMEAAGIFVLFWGEAPVVLEEERGLVAEGAPVVDVWRVVFSIRGCVGIGNWRIRLE